MGISAFSSWSGKEILIYLVFLPSNSNSGYIYIYIYMVSILFGQRSVNVNAFNLAWFNRELNIVHVFLVLGCF